MIEKLLYRPPLRGALSVSVHLEVPMRNLVVVMGMVIDDTPNIMADIGAAKRAVDLPGPGTNLTWIIDCRHAPLPLSTQETDGITLPNITNHSGIGRRETVGLIGRMLTPTSLTTVMVIDRLEKTGHQEKIGHRGKIGHQEMIVEDGRIEIVDDVTGTVAKEITTTVAVRARHAAAAVRPFGIGTETYIGDRIAISLGEEGQISHPRLRHLHLRRRLISPTGRYSPKLRTISIPLISSNSFYGRVCGQGMQQANGRTAAHGFVFGVLRYV